MGKIADYCSAVIIFLCSTQLALHFWPSSTYVYGVRVDYLSPTLYFLDILVSVYVVLKGFNKQLHIPTSLKSLSVILVANMLFSSNAIATVAWGARFMLYVLCVATIPVAKMKDLIMRLLAISMVFQVSLGIAQIARGQSLQGLLYWVGERMVNISSPNVAKWSWGGETMLRSYGTFSHPNTLAGWLVVAFLIVVVTANSTKSKKTGKYSTVGLIICTMIGIFITQSRSAALALGGVVIPFFVVKSTKSRSMYLLLCVMGLLLKMGNSSIFTWSDRSVDERLRLMKMSVQVLGQSPIFGSGTNAAISLYPRLDPSFRLLQPDHNQLTLLTSWFGLIGLAAIIGVLKQYKIVKMADLKYIAPLLPLLFLDHYFLTSSQGLFIVLLYGRFVGALRNR